MTSEKMGFNTMSELKNSDSYASTSERAYSLIMGGTLCWGLLLNALMARFLGIPILRWLYGNPQNYQVTMIVFLVGYFALCLTGSALTRTNNAFMCMLGFHMIALPVGIIVSVIVPQYSTTVVQNAFWGTAIIVFGMMVISTAIPDAFVNMGRGLGIALLLVLVVEVICGLVLKMYSGVIDYAVVAIMSLYIGYDWVRARSVPPTVPNAIAAAAALYLDIINIFLRLLRILARSRDRK